MFPTYRLTPKCERIKRKLEILTKNQITENSTSARDTNETIK